MTDGNVLLGSSALLVEASTCEELLEKSAGSTESAQEPFNHSLRQG